MPDLPVGVERGSVMGVLLQAFFRPGDKGVPCPSDGDLGADWWWDHLAMQAHAIRKAGFTAVWLPPVWKGASGIQSIGYDPYDDYDLGAKDQRGTRADALRHPRATGPVRGHAAGQ